MTMLKNFFSVVSLWMLVCVTASAGNVTYIYTDPQGTPLAEADASGNITATFDYKPYGSQALGSAPNGPAYTGHVNDPDTNFVYMQARYYDASAGRFLSVDPAAVTAADTFNFNRYGYAGNNPAKNVDPDGRAFVLDDLAGVVIGAVVGVGVEAVKDLATGHEMTWGDAAGAAAGGALMGEGVVNAPETLGGSVALAFAAKGAVVGLASNTVQQTTDIASGEQASYSVSSAAVSTVAGAVTGGLMSKVGTVKVPGVTAGRGNMSAVAAAAKTRIANGNASTMSAKTIAKGVVGGQVGDAGKTVVGGAVDGAKVKACQAAQASCQ